MPNSLYLGRIKMNNAKESLTGSLAESKGSANSYQEMGSLNNLPAWPTPWWTDAPSLGDRGRGALHAAPGSWGRKWVGAQSPFKYWPEEQWAAAPLEALTGLPDGCSPAIFFLTEIHKENYKKGSICMFSNFVICLVGLMRDHALSLWVSWW